MDDTFHSSINVKELDANLQKLALLLWKLNCELYSSVKIRRILFKYFLKLLFMLLMSNVQSTYTYVDQ